MAPHKALTIPDILCEVFKHLSIRPQLRCLPGAELGSFEFPSATGDQDDFQASKANRRTLACAACTCKVFSEPASSILWEVLDDITPIESMLRDAHMSEAEEQARVWERIDLIARRIRALSCHQWAQKPSEDDAFSSVCSHYDGRPLFPNLRVLSIYKAPGHSFLRVASASPALVLLTIATESSLVVLKMILATVADAHQELIHLNAFWLGYFDEEGFRALAKFSNLHTVHFMVIDTTLFRHLATLPNLRTLHGQFAVSNPIQVMDIRGAFPALQELSTQYMDDRTSRCFLAVLPLISSRSLVRLSLRITVPLPEDMVEYLDKLCSSPTTAQLRKLDLRADIAFSQFDNQGVPFICVTFAPDAPAPLKRLPALTDISAVVGFQTSMVASFVVHDQDLDAVASAWPGLTRAKFGHAIEFDDGTDDGPWGVSRPSLGAVVALAERCRELESVEVEFADVGARDLVQLEARADACVSEPQTALRRIVFDPDADFCYTLRVEDPPRLAAALRKLFPKLRSGLEMLQLQGEAEDSGKSRAPYRDWHPSNMDTDAFRLLKALDDIHLES